MNCWKKELWTRSNGVRSSIILISLVCFTLLAAWLPITGFFGIEWTAISIFLLLIILSFGIFWAGITIIITYGSLALYGDASLLSFVLSLMEVIAVGWLNKHFRNRIVLSDGLYWIVAGLPLTFFLYLLQTGTVDILNYYYTLNVGLNGFVAALIADLIWTYSPLRKWLRPNSMGSIVYSHMVLQLLLMAVTVPFLCFIGIDSYLAHSASLQSAAQQIESETRQLLFLMVTKISLLLLFIILTILVVLVINRFLFRSLSDLAAATAGLPRIIAGNRQVQWPSSHIFEVDQLTRNFKRITDNLNHMYQESEQVHVQLIDQKSQLETSEEKLQHLAYYDYLTGLPNRLELKRHIQMLLGRPFDLLHPRTVAVLFIDLDRFKHINDTMGHAVGDLLLQMVAGRFVQIRSENIVISRHSGDEFVIVMDCDDHSDICMFAEKLITTLTKPFDLQKQEVYVGASIGIAVYPEHGRDAGALMKNADSAMHLAKELGGNDYKFYRAGIVSKMTEKMWLENNMYKAFESNEFVLYYQMKVDSKSGGMCGMEALARWIHPDRGIISPTEFIPVAEATGFIIPLGDWILREACVQNKRWQNAGYPPMRVAVNLSARQFYKGRLLESIRSILQETQLEGKYLELEITEAFLIKDPEYVMHLVSDLSAMDIRVTIDDFGTGYSSLNQLKRFAVKSLKIDRSFIHGIELDKKNDSIVRSLIQLAHNMNLQVIGEGIETEEERRILDQYGCDEMQGYLFSKPLPVNDFESLLVKSTAV